jgi:hypothetical protein
MDSMTGLNIVSTSHAHAHPHMTTHIRICMDIGSSSDRTEHSRGGHPCSLRPRRRETSADAPPFLKALCTHCISRSRPRPPTFSPFSPAPPPPQRLPAQRQTHTQSRPRGRSIQHHTRTQYSMCAPSQWRGAHPQRMRVAGILCKLPAVGLTPS